MCVRKGNDVAPVSRRQAVLATALGVLGATMVAGHRASAKDGNWRAFIAEAERMKALAVQAGDQPFGAVVVKDGVIVGHGPSRVVSDKNPDAHAERVALWDAQRKLGTQDMTGAVIYSTSRPCAACQVALARANIGRMYHGPDGTDGGPPRGS